jgi:hypothetical protein
MGIKKHVNLNRISTEKLIQELNELLILISSSSLPFKMEEFTRIKAIALELKRRGVITEEVEKVLKEI